MEIRKFCMCKVFRFSLKILLNTQILKLKQEAFYRKPFWKFNANWIKKFKGMVIGILSPLMKRETPNFLYFC